MPLQNRVRPDGALAADASRGTLLGNRGGRIHDPVTRTLTARRWTSRRWICCEVSFRGRERTVWGDGYTELFFLDEVTALAAGHRPCFECRRQDANAYAGAVGRGSRLAGHPTADEIDGRLHAERLVGRDKRLHPIELAAAPDGAMLLDGTDALAVLGATLRRWTPAGYAEPIERPRSGTVVCLTPPTTLAALAEGFRPRWHETAARP